MSIKQYIIGRSEDCDIVLPGAPDTVSRKHAILIVTGTGKMTITDQSKNGTYINNIRITTGEPVPVSRHDIISFAHVVTLDWNKVPKSQFGLKIGGVVLAVLVAVAVSAFFFFKSCQEEPNVPTPESSSGTDTIGAPIDTTIENNSIEIANKDSVIKAQEEQIKKLQSEKKNPVKKADKEKKEPAPEEEKPAAQPIG